MYEGLVLGLFGIKNGVTLKQLTSPSQFIS